MRPKSGRLEYQEGLSQKELAMPTPLETLTQKRDQLNARIQVLKNRQQAQKRKDDTR